jgi:putative proteasome-type protease
MTYCLGIALKEGLVIAADSRTNAGVDYISIYQKLFDFSITGAKAIFLCVSGNLSITQQVLDEINGDLKTDAATNIHSLPAMHQIAQYIGEKVRSAQACHRPALEKDGIDYNCNFLLGGQLYGEDIKLYLIYSQGNFIRATPETPFLQIGETKYGKPILDRTLTYETSPPDAAKCALLSIDSTMRSNISVGPPVNLIMYFADSFEVQHRIRLENRDPYLIEFRKKWEVMLREAFITMPDIPWSELAKPEIESTSDDS